MAAFAVVCVCVIAARVYLVAVQGPDAKSGWQLPTGPARTIALVAMAGVLSALAALLGRRHFNKTSAVLMAAAAGGLTTAGYNGLLGAVPGAMVGLLVVSRIARRTALALLVGICAIAFGLVSGTFALWLDPDLSDGPSVATLSFVVVALIASGAVLFRRRANAAARGWRWLRRLGKVCLLSFIVGGLWLSLSTDLVRRVWRLTRDPRYLSGVWPVDLRLNPYGRSIGLRPLSGEWLWPGPLRLDSAFLVLRDEVTDNDLRALRGWTKLWSLTIRGDHITDSGLVHLSALTSLSELRLRSPHVTDQGFESLSQMRGLESLELDRSHVTASGLSKLSPLPRLGHLSLKDVPLDDEGLATLQAFPALRSLSLSGTGTSDAGLRYLSSLPLVELDLSHTNIRDEGLRHITSLVTLGNLNLSETRISKRGLRILSQHLNSRVGAASTSLDSHSAVFT